MGGNGRLMLLDITVISAEDLQKVNHVTTMDVYGEVSINGDDCTRQGTQMATKGGSNPEWNCRMMFIIAEDSVHQKPFNLSFHLKSDRMFRDKDIGTVEVPVEELLDRYNRNEKAEQYVRYNIRLPSGEEKGILSFSYKFTNDPQVPGHEAMSHLGKKPAVAYRPTATVDTGPSSSSGYQQAPGHAPDLRQKKHHGGFVKQVLAEIIGSMAAAAAAAATVPEDPTEDLPEDSE